MKRKKSLLITTRPIYPINGGDRRRTDLLLRMLNNYGQVDVALNVLWYEDLCKTKHTLIKNKNTSIIGKITLIQSIKNLAKGLVSKRPIQNTVYDNKTLSNKINWSEYDVIICHLSRSESIVPKNLNNVIIDLTDNLLIHYNKVSFNWTLKSLLFILERKRFRYYYNNLNSNFTYSVISQRDKIYDNNIVIRNDSRFYGNRHDPNSKNLVFIGNMNSYPNREAILEFYEKNIDLFIEKGYKLYVLGNNSKSFLNDKNWVNVYAYDKYDCLFNLDIEFRFGLAPMISGAGLQNKVIDYLGCSLPVLGTSLVFDSFPQPVEKGQLFLSEDNISNYSNLIESMILTDTKMHIKWCEKYLHDFFSFEKIAENVIEYFTQNLSQDAI